MMWWHGGHYGFGAAGGLIGMGFMVLFWIIVVDGIIFLVRHSAGPRRPGYWGGHPTYPADSGFPRADQAGSSAMQILEERYARGEIDRDEFLKRKADLTGGS